LIPNNIYDERVFRTYNVSSFSTNSAVGVGDPAYAAAVRRARLHRTFARRIIDGSDAVCGRTKDAPVTIERDVFGTPFVKVDGGDSSARVRRVQ